MKAVLDKARNLNIITKLMAVSFILLACIFGYELLNNKTYAAETSVFAYSASTSYVRAADEVTIKLQGVEDKLYKSNTLTADKITVKVGDTTVTPSTKTLTSETAALGMPRYSLTLSGLTGNGALKISIANSTISDDAGNANNINEWSTPVVVDNALPTAGTMTLKLDNSAGDNYDTTKWTNHNVYVAVNNGSDTGSGHKSTTYTVDGGSTQTVAQTISTQGTHTIVVTTTDNALNTSTRTYTIKIDKSVPTISVSPTTAPVAKTTSVKIVVGESGGSGLLSTNSYQYQLGTSNTTAPTGTWTTYSSASTGTTVTLGSGLTGTYYLWIKEIKDNAENISTAASSTKVSTYHVFGTYAFDNKAPTIAFSPNGNTTYAKLQSLVVKATDSGTAGVNTSSLKYQWTQSTTAPAESTFTTSFTNGGTITKTDGTGTNWYLWILAKDTLGNTSITKSNPFYLDNAVPTYTSYAIKNVTTTGYDVYVYGVADANSGVNRVQFPSWTGDTQDDIQANWATAGSKASGTNQGNGTWYYRVNVTDHKNEYGSYNTHIYIYDNLGNTTSFATKDVATGALPNVPAVKVTYDNNDGSSNKMIVQKGYGAELGTLPTATRKGYTFSGWYTATSGGTQISSITTTPSNDITYYAHWTIITYNISYDLDGGSVLENPNTYNIETPTFTLNSPTKTGYIFSGWTESQDGLGTIASLSTGITFNGTQITIINTKDGNVYSNSKIQLWNGTTYLQQINATSNASISGDFTNTYDTGNYRLRFGANGSTQDSTFYVSVYLVKGVTYHYEWDVELFSQSKIVINNLKFYKNDGSTIGIPNSVIGKGNIGNRKYTKNGHQ